MEESEKRKHPETGFPQEEEQRADTGELDNENLVSNFPAMSCIFVLKSLRGAI